MNPPSVMPVAIPLQESLTVLRENDFFRSQADAPPSDPAYIFKHALMQDTVEATLLKHEHKRLHRLVGEAIERVYADRVAEFVPQLALHFRHAEEDPRALAYSLRAGDDAARLYAHAEASEEYGHALALAQRLNAPAETLIYLYTAQGRMLEVAGNHAGALALYEELHAQAQARNDPTMELTSLSLRATLYSAPLSTHNPTLGKELLLEALGMARELGDEVAEARILWNLTLWSVHTMQAAQGIPYGEAALAIAERRGLTRQKALALHELYQPYRADGQVERARSSLAQARQLFRELGDQPMLADNLGMSAQMAMVEGDLTRAIAFATEGVAASEAAGNPFGTFFNRATQLLAHMEQGEFASALELVRQEDSLATQSPASASEYLRHAYRLSVYTAMGAFEMAQAVESSLQAALRQPMPPVFRAVCGMYLSQYYLARGDVVAAEGYLKESADEPPKPPPWYAPFTLAQTRVQILRGETASTPTTLQELAQALRRDQTLLFLPETYWQLAQVNRAQGRTDAARAALIEAQTLAERMGLRRLLWQIRADAAELERAAGDIARADELSAQARTEMLWVADHTPPEFRASFLTLPNARKLME